LQAQFNTVGILGKPSDPSIADTLSILYEYLKNSHFKILIEPGSAKFLPVQEQECCPLEQFGNHCDVVLAVGGDGTFLTAARAIASFHVPLIGINLGRVGFLVDISPSEMLNKLDAILFGKFKEEKSHLLRTQVIRENAVIHEETSVNEVVIHRWITPSMIEIITTINGVYLNTQRSDGLIISTPTGSTAYALSAGGPIISPALKVLVLVPLNPHMLSNRPIVIDDSAEISISFSQNNQMNALITCDHVQIPKVLISDTIVIKKDPDPIRILHPEDHDFYHTLREKLSWSSDYHT
jgi:NAD+ kinase